jgi:sugar lactone lactonase YvrE
MIFLIETKSSTHSITTAMEMSTLTSSAAYTTMVFDVTTVTSLNWNSSGITVAGGNGNSIILNPYAIFVDDQYNMYIAEKGNSRISKWPSNPNGLPSAAVFQTASGQLNQPPSLYVDSATGSIYVADEQNHRVVCFTNGSTTGFNVTSILSGTSATVSGIYLDPNGTIFITDSGQNRIYNWFTNRSAVGGQGAGSGANQLNQPKRFFIDSNYTFYVADSTNARVQKWFAGATSGETVAGGYGTGSNASQLYGPLGVVVDSQGNILVCDSGNHRVQIWSPGATTGQTIAGNANGTAGSGSTGLNGPKGIAIDKSNNLYVVDNGNLRIQKFNFL